MCLSLETLTSIIRTASPILVELIDLVNSIIIFLSQMTLLGWLTFLLGFLSLILTVCSFGFIPSDASICSTMAVPPLGNSDHVVVSVSNDFLSNSKRDGPFQCIAYNYSCADWEGLRNQLRDVPWEDMLSLVFLLLLVNFLILLKLELMYISLIVSIRSSLTHLHGFQLLVLLP